MTGDLVVFLKACLDEDEAVARAATLTTASWHTGLGKDAWTRDLMVFDDDGVPMWDNEGSQGLSMPEGVAPHVARWDPERVLAEVQAKRHIIEELERLIIVVGWTEEEHGGNDTEGLRDLLRLLALPYASCGGYRSEWAPDTEVNRG